MSCKPGGRGVLSVIDYTGRTRPNELEWGAYRFQDGDKGLTKLSF